ncbi:MAG: signal transduction histidine kinase LytS [Ignavibacteria bacterium]|nr:MAG: signal transduction histidine kinase LytS [Ignavibacteria bacterium]KAF0161304.1 MAG: signal transduction histidine kinase LytS [Ignavibacteria bacterium]
MVKQILKRVTQKEIVKNNFYVIWVKLYKRIFTLVILFSLTFIASIYSQTPSYYHYKSTDGLASATVFEIIQDKEGFIWLATQSGVSRFDGKRFTTYTVEDGLNSNMITSLTLGIKGEIFFATYEKGINILKNGHIKSYYDHTKGKLDHITFLINVPSANNNKLLANTRGSYINALEKNNTGKLVNKVVYLEQFILNKIDTLTDGRIIALTKKGLFEIKNDAARKINIEGNPSIESYSLANSSDGSFYIGSKGNIYSIKNNKVIYTYKVNVGGNNEVSNLLKDKKGNLWFSVMNKGFFKIPYDSKEIINIGKKMNLQTTNVNHLFEDKEGNIWLGTYGKGAYCLTNFHLSSYTEEDGLSNNSVHSITKDKSGKVFIGTYNGVNLFYKNKFEHIKKDPVSPLTEYIHNVKVLNDGVYIAGGFPNTDRERVVYKGVNYNFHNRPTFIRTKNGLNIFGTTGNHIKIHRNFFLANRFAFQDFSILGDSLISNRINDLYEDTDGNIWVGSTFGLCQLSNFTETSGKVNWDKTYFPSYPVLNSKIRSIYQDSNGKVWFAGDLGIANYDLRSGSISEYKSINGYDLSFSTSISSDKKGRIWIGTMRGLYLLNGAEIIYLNSKTGLPTDEVLSLFYDEEKNILYVGTSSGISLLDIKLFDEFLPLPPAIKLISIQAGDSIYTENQKLVFEHEANNIYIEFAGLNFSSPGAMKYKYKLNNEWIETDYNFLNFTSLKHGEYNIAISAKAQNTSWGKPITVSFIVLPRFVETVWFILLIFGLILLLVLAVVVWRIKLLSKKNKDKLELTERINELKHQALSAMMNPHFIFNSLNSVQYLINHQKNEEANNYIAMMAKLIRKNLDTAGSGFISLSEEINRLKLYLDLEKLRFQEKFSYEIILGNNVESDSLLIPNMIIQPFVENSLWHGIINSGATGQLTVSFLFEYVEIDSLVSKSLVIRVTDNGVGIKEASRKKKEDHISKGIQIIEERLKLLSAKMELPKPIILEDLSERNNNSQGTEVIISLSSPMYKHISNN